MGVIGSLLFMIIFFQNCGPTRFQPNENTNQSIESEDFNSGQSLQTNPYICRVFGGAGRVLEEHTSTERSQCQTLCEAYKIESPNRQCEWGSEVIHSRPLGQCQITIEGESVYMAKGTRNNCVENCDKQRYKYNQAEAFCRWNSDVF